MDQEKEFIFRNIITKNGRVESKSNPYVKEHACELREDFRKEAKEATQLLQKLCNETKPFLSKEEQPKTLMDLLEFILKQESNIVTKGHIDINKVMSFFPDISDKSENGTLTRPYIFEALWKIVFLLEQDGLFSGKTRTFKEKLEHPRPGRDISVEKYLEKKINGGNESGIADIMFTLSGEQIEKKRSPCDSKYKKQTAEAILVSSKYYQKEHGINKYDINELIVEATKGTNNGIGGYNKDEFSIIVLVKDKIAFKKVLHSTHEKEVANYLSYEHILDVSDLQQALTRLYSFMKTKYIDLSNVRDPSWYTGNLSVKPSIISELRFHQQYIVTYTDTKINEGGSKFIWGAVPRSGKSYMVGGLIATKKPRYVILILGAISETKNQFIDIFNDYEEFEKYEYEIIDMQELTSYDRESKINKVIHDDTGRRYIFVYSQELLREHIKYYEKYKYKLTNPVDIIIKRTELLKQKMSKEQETIIKELNGTLLINLMKNIFKNDPYIFFDEVQQGSGYTNSKNQQDEILHHLYTYRDSEPILVLVTATYAKPILKYNEKLNKKPIHLITWSYENNNVRMKQFDAYELSEFVEEEEDRLKKINILETLVKQYEERDMTRIKIAQQYRHYPELVLLSPETINLGYELIKDGEIDVNKLFKKNKDGFSESSNIDKLLDYIHKQYDQLYKEYNISFSGSDSKSTFHSQLWFLPTTLRNEHVNENEDETSFADTSEFLAKQICKNKFYENFNIAIVHSLKSKSMFGQLRRLKSENRIFLCNYDDDKNDIKTILTEVEVLSEKESKSLIILTGKRLRLGISLACVDLAIHLDPISSVDTLYQSMFRVLTERKGKKRGYVIDLLPKRNIKFMYEICEYTGNRKVTMERVKHGLYLFNVNFVRNLVGRPDSHSTSMYKELMKSFHVDNINQFVIYQDELFKTRIEEIKHKFKKIVGELDIDVKKRLTNLISNLLESNKKNTLKKGKKSIIIQQSSLYNPKSVDYSDEILEENDELTDMDIESLFTKLSFLFSLFVFYHNNSTLNDFYDEYKQSVHKYTPLEIKSCDHNTIHICFVNYQMAMKKILQKDIQQKPEKRERKY